MPLMLWRKPFAVVSFEKSTWNSTMRTCMQRGHSISVAHQQCDYQKILA